MRRKASIVRFLGRDQQGDPANEAFISVSELGAAERQVTRGEAPRPTRTGVVLSFSLNTINHLR